MTTAGWVFLLLSWGMILSLLSFCYGRILRGKKSNDDDIAKYYDQ